MQNTCALILAELNRSNQGSSAKSAQDGRKRLSEMILDRGVGENFSRAALGHDLSSVQSGEAGVQQMLAALAEEAGLYQPKDDSDAEPQVDRAEELRQEWGVEPGQLWRLPSRTPGQEHLIYCGDRTSRDDLPFGTEFADLCVTDPPYGTMATGRGGKSIAGDQTYNAVLGLFDTLPLTLKPGAPFYVMGGTFNMPMVYKLFDITFRQVPTVIVWDKCQFVMRHHDYHNQWEAIFYSWKPGEGPADARWHGDRKQADVWRIERDGQSERVNITTTPRGLYKRRHLKKSNPGH